MDKRLRISRDGCYGPMSIEERDITTDHLRSYFPETRLEGIADGWLQYSWFVGMTPAGEAVYIMDAETHIDALGRLVPSFFAMAYTLVDGYPTGDEDKMRCLITYTTSPATLVVARMAAKRAINPEA